jgi:hypothetical protein
MKNSEHTLSETMFSPRIFSIKEWITYILTRVPLCKDSDGEETESTRKKEMYEICAPLRQFMEKQD